MEEYINAQEHRLDFPIGKPKISREHQSEARGAQINLLRSSPLFKTTTSSASTPLQQTHHYAQQHTPMPDALTRLPLSVIASIVTHLGCCSMRNALLASSHLRSLCVVILHNNNPTGFNFFQLLFHIPGIDVIGSEKFQPEWHTEKIKLHEVIGEIGTDHISVFFRQNRHKLDRISFVHLMGVAYDPLIEERAEFRPFQQCFQLQLAMIPRVLVSWRRCYKVPPESVEMTEFEEPDQIHVGRFAKWFGKYPRVNPFPQSSSLRSLNIAIDFDFVDLSLPSLTHLSIHFCTPSGSVRWIPKLMNIEAREVYQLKVRYAGVLPLMAGLRFNSRYLCFDLCNTLSNGLGLWEYLIDNETRKKDYKKMDLSFLRDCTHVWLEGTPSFLFDFARSALSYALCSCSYLCWINSVKYAEVGRTTLDQDIMFGVTQFLTVLNKVPGFTLPRFYYLHDTMGRSLRPRDIVLFLMAPGFKMNNFILRNFSNSEVLGNGLRRFCLLAYLSQDVFYDPTRTPC